MNFLTLLSSGSLILFVFCSFISLSVVDADRIRIIQRTSKTPAKLHVSKAAAPSVYAKKYSYNNPIPSFSAQGKFGKNKRFVSRRNGKNPRNYANGYKNWSPDNNYSGINNPRIDNIKRGPQKKRKEPSFLIREGSFNNKQKNRIRPQKINILQRPQPPRQVNDFDEDYFFPEEAVRTETKFDYESSFQKPKKRRRNPNESEKVIKGPELKFPIFNEKPSNQFKQQNRDRPFSYSTFVEHPNSDEDFEEEEKQQYTQPIPKNKKKKLKKKSNFRKKIKEEEYYSSERDEEPEGYQSTVYREYQTSPKRSKRPNKKPTRDEDDYYTDMSHYNKLKTQGYVTQNVGLSAVEENYSNYKDNFRPQSISNYNPSLSQSWHTVIETTARPIVQQPQNGLFSTQYNSNSYNFQNSYQNPKIQQAQTYSSTQQENYYSQPDNSYRIVPTSNPQTNFNYNYNQYSDQITAIKNQQSNAFSNSVHSSQSSPTYQQPSNFYQNSVTIQKSVPIYDNTQTFYNYNNPYVQSHVTKHQQDESPVYKQQAVGSQLSGNYATEIPQRADDEYDFVKKHQNLYNKGLSGVPVQGDGYGSNSAKKDYDIGYGDFQFDENPSS